MRETYLLLPGHRYERLRSASGANPIRKPLLHCDENIRRLAGILTDEYGPHATLFVGHGSTHPAGPPVYKKLADCLHAAGFAKSYLAVLEGAPGFDRTAGLLLKNDVRYIRLAALMLRSGRHAEEDIFGKQAGSWLSRLKTLGIAVTPDRRSLLSFPSVVAMFEDPALEPVGSAIDR